MDQHPLTRYRAEHALTLEGFAARVGVAKGTVSKWENGTIPRPVYMQRIAEETKGNVTALAWYEAPSEHAA